MSMSMLKNGGFQMTTTPTIEVANQNQKQAFNRNSLAGESSLDFKLATLRNEMVILIINSALKSSKLTAVA